MIKSTIKELLFLIIISLFITEAKAQLLEENFRQSLNTFIYKINASQALGIYSGRNLPDSLKYFTNPVDSFRYNQNYDYSLLKPGHYLIIQAADNTVRYRIYETPSFIIHSAGINDEIEVFVYDLKGNLVKDAVLKTVKRGAKIGYQDDCGCYPIPLPPKELNINPVDFMILKGNDFSYCSVNYFLPQNPEPAKKWWKRKVPAQTYNDITLLPGYLVLNQPKFRLLDTLKWKAFLMKPDGKPYKRNIICKIFNASRGILQFRKSIKPLYKGAYSGEFAIPDTFSLDDQYRLELYSKKGILLKSENFTIENYELKKSDYNATLDKNYFFAGEEIKFTVTAFDANKLPLLDTKVNVRVMMTQLDDFFEDSLFIPYSWNEKFWEYSTITDPGGITVITLPAKILPRARMHFNALVTFTSSDGELKQFNLAFTYDPTAERYQLFQEGDSIRAIYLVNSKPVKKAAIIKSFNNQLLDSREIMLPYTFKTEDFPQSYQLFADGNLQSALNLDDNLANGITFSGSRSYDSVQFKLINPLGLTVYYKMYHGNELVDRGSGRQLSYCKYMPSDNPFHVIYSFRWKGVEYFREAIFQAREKGLNVSIDQPEIIYPGQKVPVTVKVTDYKNQVLKNVNLAAYAVNAQFGDLVPPQLPYFGTASSGILKTFNAFLNPVYIQTEKPVSAFYYKLLHLYESPYYRLILDPSGKGSVYEKTETGTTEFSPYVFRGLYNQVIFEIFVDKKPVYFSGTNMRNPYSFRVDEGLHDVELRTSDKMITIKNVRFEKGKKLFLCVREDMLTGIPDVSYVSLSNPFLAEEQKLIIGHLFFFSQKYKRTPHEFYLLQGNRILKNSAFNYTNSMSGQAFIFSGGPFQKGPIKLIRPEVDTINFYFDPGSYYTITDSTVEYTGKLPDDVLKATFSNNFYSFNTSELSFSLPPKSKPPEVPKPAPEIPKVRTHPALHDYSTACNFRPYSGFIFKNISQKSIKSIWMFNNDDEKESRIYFNQNLNSSGLKPGHYDIMIISADDSLCLFKNYYIRPDGTNYKFISKKDFKAADSLLVENAKDRIVALNLPAPRLFNNPPVGITEFKTISKKEKKQTALSGYLLDQNNNPVDMAVIFLEENGVFINGAFTNQMGYFEMNVTKSSIYQFKISVNGKFFYLNKIFVPSDKITEISIYLPGELGQPFKWTMEPVNVSEGSIDRAENYSQKYEASSYSEKADVGSIQGARTLAYKVPLIASVAGEITNSFAVANQAQSTLPANPSETSKFREFLDKIKGDTSAGRIRSHFRDYAYFIPNLFTDKQGEAHFTVIFPDNQTLWKTFVPAVDYHKRTGLGQKDTKAYKPLNSTLALPKFLLVGDSVQLTGKIYNYTRSEIALSSGFQMDGKELKISAGKVRDYHTDSLYLKAATAGTHKIRYSFTTNDGFVDGEERKLPIYSDGIESAKSVCFEAEGDTTMVFNADPSLTQRIITLSNSRLDLVSGYISKLKEYNYGCNEQVASKLIAILAEKTIVWGQNKKFTGDKQVAELVKKLESTQHADGSWGWWTIDNPAETWMSIYITGALDMAAKEGYHTHAQIKGAEYIRNNFLNFGITDRLSAIELLVPFFPEYNFKPLVNKADSMNLSLQDRFRLIRIKQLLGVHYDMKPVLSNVQESSSGSYWAEQVLDFKTNEVITSAIAYEILKNDSSDHEKLLLRTRSYLITHLGKAENTYVQAVLIHSVVNDISDEKRTGKELTNHILIDGKELTTASWPVMLTKKPGEQVNIRKSGAPLYVSDFRFSIDKALIPVDSLYAIKSWTEQNGHRREIFKTGTNFILNIEMIAKKNTEFVMIEIPVPSSSYYADKHEERMPYEVYREYFDNKVVIFCRNLPKGKHLIKISLQARFAGISNILPVSARLMYQPDHGGVGNRMGISVIK
ncbi:MAG: hypothetical protein NTW49_09455 [Bacteroidia bacterium]|nr:hypothetical protein [Bacteroidia bacterium]